MRWEFGLVWLERGISSGAAAGRWKTGVAVGVTALALAAAIVITSRRGGLKSPWARRKRKRPLSRQQWNDLFTLEGKLCDGGVKLLKKIRCGGIEPSIRAEVWPFLLGVYDFKSSDAERMTVRKGNRKEYLKLRRECCQLHEHTDEGDKELKTTGSNVSGVESPNCNDGAESPSSIDVLSARQPVFIEKGSLDGGNVDQVPVPDETSTITSCPMEEEGKSVTPRVDASQGETETSDADSSLDEELESTAVSFVAEGIAKDVAEGTAKDDLRHTKSILPKRDAPKSNKKTEDFDTWQRIIRLDAVRANAEWIAYSPTQAAVSKDEAQRSAMAVGLEDYDHLEPCRIYHAARLIAVLEAYALYDPEIGYCQGMSDLLTPLLAVIEEDDVAFWCFVGFMKKARHNFRLDEVGIRRQLSIVSRIIKCKDARLYGHLQKLQVEDCFFVYRMVVVLFRRELSFEQTLSLWEVMWADQAAIRAGIGKSAWGRIRLQEAPPPTEDLLLYAIAACVLQRRKLIIERYSSMDEIIRECNNMAGHLDVWKLLDDAHDLVATLHDKI